MGEMQIVDNYRPLSLLAIFGKILERLVFNSLFEFLQENHLPNEDSDHLICVNIGSYQLCMINMHLLTVVYLVMSGTILDISQSFDRVWHEGPGFNNAI